MNKRIEIMNHKSFDLSLLSDSSRDTQTNTAGDFDASENCTLLLEDNKKPLHDGILHRIAHYTKRRSRFRGEFCDDSDDDDHRNSRFYASSRLFHKKTIKRYLFLFGFVSTLIIFSQLCLSLYSYEPVVEGLYALDCHYIRGCFQFCLYIFFSPYNQSRNSITMYNLRRIK